MRQAHVFPEIDNTTAPLLYPLFIKVFTVLQMNFGQVKLYWEYCVTFFMVFSLGKRNFIGEKAF